MTTRRRSLFIGFAFAFAFLALGWTGVSAKLLQPFTRESSIYAGTVAGLLMLTVVLPAFAVLAGAAAALAAPRTQRLPNAVIALVTSLAVMGLGVLGTRSSNSAATPKAPTSIVIANPIETGKEIEMQVGSPFVLRVYALEGIALPDGALRAELMVFVPGTIERKIVATSRLQATGNKTENGFLIYEGSLTTLETHGAKNGFLSVFGHHEHVTRAGVVIKPN